MKSVLKPISCETGLRSFEYNVVENAAEKLIEEASNDLSLRSLSLHGDITLESHTNLRAADNPVTEPTEHMSIDTDDNRVGAAAVAASAPAPALTPLQSHSASPSMHETGLHLPLHPERSLYRLLLHLRAEPGSCGRRRG